MKDDIAMTPRGEGRVTFIGKRNCKRLYRDEVCRLENFKVPKSKLKLHIKEKSHNEKGRERYV